MRPSMVNLMQTAVGDRPCIVALGGGADSAALLAAALEGLGPDRVRGVFVYHGLEGSNELQAAVTGLTHQIGADLTVIEALVVDGPDLEARTREVRYEALAADLRSGEVCCTAHTHDDQAETVFMRLMRGSGSTGMSGLSFSLMEPGRQCST